MNDRTMHLVRGAVVLGLAASALIGITSAEAERPFNYGDCVSEGTQPNMSDFGPLNTRAAAASEGKLQQRGQPSDGASRFDFPLACGD